MSALAVVVDTFAWLVVAVLLGTFAALLVKTPARLLSRVALGAAALLCALASIWATVRAVPIPERLGPNGIATLAAAALIAGLIVEELIGSDLRRLTGIGDDAKR